MASGMLLEQGGRGHFHRDPHEEKMILDKLGELNRPDEQRTRKTCILLCYILYFHSFSEAEPQLYNLWYMLMVESCAARRTLYIMLNE